MPNMKIVKGGTIDDAAVINASRACDGNILQASR